jgi:16S rRNA (cytidine1402-2'-O)-methyltransferase
MRNGTLSVVATPIGNLEDITYRAIWTLSEAEVIVCEDTRVTAKLLAHLKIKKPLLALHEHSDAAALSRIVGRLKAGERVAYVCDAGTPNVNDPGGKLVAAAFDAGAKVEPIPGPSALTAAISVCGFPMNVFCYAGFAPTKKGRARYFKAIAEREEPTIFFESTHRILKTLTELSGVLAPKRMVFVGRELTKLHETLYRGTIAEVIDQLSATSTKGEFVAIVGPRHVSSLQYPVSSAD